MPPNPASPTLRLGAVILAAGSSSRMGQPKLLLPWGSQSILEHLLEQWKSLGAGQRAVVVGTGESPVAAALDRLNPPEVGRIINPDPGRGMFSSIQCAAQWPGWDAHLTHWSLSLGDQPHVRLETLRRLLELAANHPGAICQPARRGRPKHPIVLPRTEFLELARAGATDLKAHLASRPCGRRTFDSDDEGLDFDIDHPEDYRRALAWAKAGVKTNIEH